MQYVVSTDTQGSRLQAWSQNIADAAKITGRR